jgi:beta-galactosidase
MFRSTKTTTINFQILDFDCPYQLVNSAKHALLILFFFLSPHCTSRVVTELNDNWKFRKGENALAYQKEFNDRNWQTVTVPHDWAIYGPFDKEIDKQVVAIVQNGEKVPAEKTTSFL